MGVFKSDAEIEELLNHSNNALHKANVSVKIIGSGNHGNHSHDDKKNGNQIRDKDVQASIATLATLIGNKAAGEIFDVGPTQVSQYKNGKNASNIVDVTLKARTEEKLEGITTKTVDKVDQLLEIFAEDKMAELKASEIPSAAEKLINMVDKINRRHDKTLPDGLRPNVVLYSPKQINITEYITKEV